jgi:diaminopimelate decarboxylase
MLDTHALARRFGTPLYVYQLDRIRRAARDLMSALPDEVRLYYSFKANPHPSIIAELGGLGLHGEISSVGELDAAARARLHGDRCMYTGPGKTPEELSAAVEAGVRLFSVESPRDRDRLAAAAEAHGVDVEYAVRLNGSGPAGGGLRMTGRSSQFGVDAEQQAEMAEAFKACGRARPVGAHVFAASNVSGTQALLEGISAAVTTVADTFRTTGVVRQFADLGGGFAAPFAVPGGRPDYRTLREPIERLLDKGLPGWRTGEPRVAFESGRHLVADSGTLLTTVLDVKASRGRTYAVLDAGVNVLGGMWGTGRLPTPSARPEAEPGDTCADVTLVGPLCTPLDVLGRPQDAPGPRVGQILRIPNVGAYGLSASLIGFLSRPIPTEVVVDAAGEVVNVRTLELREAGGRP